MNTVWIRKVGAHIFLALHAFMIILEGVLMGNIIDVLYAGDTELFLHQLILIFAAIAVGMVAGILAWKLVHSVTKVHIKRMRFSIFHFDIWSKSKFELADYSTNADMVYSNVLLANWNIASSVYLIFFAVWAMLSIHPVLLIVSILISLLPLIVPKLVGNVMQQRVQSYTQENQAYQSYISERLKGREELRQYQVTEACEREHSDFAERVETKRESAKNMSNFAKILSASLASFSFFGVIAAGGGMVVNGLVTVGGIITIIEMMNYTVDPLVTISDMLKEKKGCQGIVQAAAQKESKGREHQAPKSERVAVPLSVSLEHVGFSYGEQRKILDDFSYTFEPGKKYLIQGSSGTGKSTLGKLIAGELKPQTGNIKIGGVDIGKTEEEIYNQVRKVNQEPFLFSESIADNIKFYREILDKDVKAVLKEVNLNYLELEQEFDENLSGGEQARISIARSLLDMPGVVVYDEPTAALDDKNTEELMKLITEQEKTVLCISHNTSEVVKKLFDEVVVLKALE